MHRRPSALSVPAPSSPSPEHAPGLRSSEDSVQESWTEGALPADFSAERAHEHERPGASLRSYRGELLLLAVLFALGLVTIAALAVREPAPSRLGSAVAARPAKGTPSAASPARDGELGPTPSPLGPVEALRPARAPTSEAPPPSTGAGTPVGPAGSVDAKTPEAHKRASKPAAPVASVPPSRAPATPKATPATAPQPASEPTDDGEPLPSVEDEEPDERVDAPASRGASEPSWVADEEPADDIAE
ncbi:MAG: hypothetical protein H6713_04085 [Myxococcales bacterium]|nr:hypothetical protein [Myxococcales bacterium]